MKDVAYIEQVTEYYGKEWLPAARSGDAEAQCRLGLRLQAVGENDAAFPWFEKAGSKGHAQALNNLGLAFLYARGTQQSITKGMRYLEQAGTSGYAPAYDNLAGIYQNGSFGIGENYRIAMRYAEMAVDMGDMRALDRLCQLYTQCEEYDQKSLDEGYIAEAFELFQSALKKSRNEVTASAALSFLTRATTLLCSGNNMMLVFPDETRADLLIPAKATGMVAAFREYQKALTCVPAEAKAKIGWNDHLPFMDVEAADSDFVLKFLDGTSARVRLVAKRAKREALKIAS